MQPSRPNDGQFLASQAETGRACPYCRFPLKEGVDVVDCGVCHTPHHADCWHDNCGCAISGCAGGPTAVAGRVGEVGVASPDAYPAVSPASPAQSGAPPAPPPPSGERRTPSLAIAVIVLAVAIAGVAVAIVLGRQGNNVHLAANASTQRTVTVPATTATTPASTSTGRTGTPEDVNPATTRSATTPSAATTPATAAPHGEGALPGVSPQETQAEIQHALLEWHEDVVNGNYHAAWELLSQRKQVQDNREYGYSTWVKNQATLRPYLNPSGLQVSVEHAEPSSGVAQVYVSGMSWDKPGASCTEWSGVTWVKYEDGAWRYDPGYSTTPQREREWKPRYSELLGGRC
jgi:hypothetical protein